jgi:superfamily I DNA and/or RNA helicase
LVTEILAPGGMWINREGQERALRLADVLVVAPYKLQVQLIEERLTASGLSGSARGHGRQVSGAGGARRVVFDDDVEPEDAPRGFGFLFSLNRLNVATSRSQGIVILVASPRLLEARCETPKQSG